MFLGKVNDFNFIILFYQNYIGILLINVTCNAQLSYKKNFNSIQFYVINLIKRKEARHNVSQFSLKINFVT